MDLDSEPSTVALTSGGKRGVMSSIRRLQALASAAWNRLKPRSRLNSTAAAAESVEELFQLILGRPIDNEEFKRQSHNSASLRDWVERLVQSEEFRLRCERLASAKPDFIPDASYRSPRLWPAAPPAAVLIAGSCFSETWSQTLSSPYPEMRLRHVLSNNASELEDIPDDLLREFSFQIGQISLRSIIHEAEYFAAGPNSLAIPSNEEVYQVCLHRLRANFDSLLKYNRRVNLPVFVLNFAV